MNSETSYCYPDNNATCIKPLRRIEISVLLYLSSGILIVVAVFGNLFVIITVSHFRQLHTPTNFFILSLAVADFLSGSLILPAQFSAIVEYCWYFGDAFCPYYHTYFYFLFFVSVLNLVSISVDRYIAVCNPFFYSSYVTNSVAGICIIFTWLLAFFYTCAFIFWTGGFVVSNWCVGMCAFFHYRNWWIIHYVVTFLLPMVVIICLYSVIFVTARRHVKAINCMMQETKSADRKNKQLSKSSERKAAKTLGIVVINFIVLCSPCFLFFLLQLFLRMNFADIVPLRIAVIYLAAMNCCIDPVIYALFYPWFRKSLKMMVTLEIFKSSSSMTSLFSN
ncbi:trace amine-associated receptor 6-like [Erpetoichthys calabaricus]|uniref:trace amine-associated receptor 6-like n=1 Tax=Erpetoichthys calabaricus TaxID=27687 RepID=UPI002234BD65|nr:trace amine-associated receptor 6-like [Erpetoichthys calabaricus]